MKKWQRCFIAATAALFMGAQVAEAETVTDNFSFYDSSNFVIATGSFSYDSSKTGIVTYDDLSSFTVSLFPPFGSFDLAFVRSLSSLSGDYIYFGYDVATNAFVSARISGYNGDQSGVLAATDGNVGFFFDPLPGMADLANTGADGLVVGYTPSAPDGSVALTAALYSISAVPEPSTWAMMIVGFVGVAAVSIRRRLAIAALP